MSGESSNVAIGFLDSSDLYERNSAYFPSEISFLINAPFTVPSLVRLKIYGSFSIPLPDALSPISLTITFKDNFVSFLSAVVVSEESVAVVVSDESAAVVASDEPAAVVASEEPAAVVASEEVSLLCVFTLESAVVRPSRQ